MVALAPIAIGAAVGLSGKPTSYGVAGNCCRTEACRNASASSRI